MNRSLHCLYVLCGCCFWLGGQVCSFNGEVCTSYQHPIYTKCKKKEIWSQVLSVTHCYWGILFSVICYSITRTNGPKKFFPFYFSIVQAVRFTWRVKLLLLYHIAVLQGKLLLRSLTLKAFILECWHCLGLVEKFQQIIPVLQGLGNWFSEATVELEVSAWAGHEMNVGVIKSLACKVNHFANHHEKPWLCSLAFRTQRRLREA